MNHVDARAIVVDAFRQVFLREPSRSETQFLQAVCYLETQYGAGWRGAGRGSNNWGAVQGGRPPCDPQRCFEYTDTAPQPDGTSRAYRICFKRYASPVDGAADVACVMYRQRPGVLAAATCGDAYEVSARMYDTMYYQGFGHNREERIARHHKRMLHILGEIATACGESLPDGGEPPLPTLRRGAQGELVKALQRELGIVADGMFGPATEHAAAAFQRAHHLKPDGIVGPATWAMLHTSAS